MELIRLIRHEILLPTASLFEMIDGKAIKVDWPSLYYLTKGPNLSLKGRKKKSQVKI